MQYYRIEFTRKNAKNNPDQQFLGKIYCAVKKIKIFFGVLLKKKI